MTETANPSDGKEKVPRVVSAKCCATCKHAHDNEMLYYTCEKYNMWVEATQYCNSYEKCLDKDNFKDDEDGKTDKTKT